MSNTGKTRCRILGWIDTHDEYGNPNFYEGIFGKWRSVSKAAWNVYIPWIQARACGVKEYDNYVREELKRQGYEVYEPPSLEHLFA